MPRSAGRQSSSLAALIPDTVATVRRSIPSSILHRGSFAGPLVSMKLTDAGARWLPADQPLQARPGEEDGGAKTQYREALALAHGVGTDEPGELSTTADPAPAPDSAGPPGPAAEPTVA
jgi:hypothetical protein